MKIYKLGIVIACLFSLSVTSGCALLFMHQNSEQVVTLKVGPSWANSTDVKHDFGQFGVFEVKNVNYDTGVAVGLGVEHWFGSAPNFGIGFEVEQYNANSPKQERTECFTGFGCGLDTFVSQHYNATAFEFLLRARYGFMTSNDYRNGRYQLLALLGPAIFLSRYFDAGNHFVPGQQTDSDTTVGIATGIGFRYMVTPNIDLSMEYRFKYFSPRFNVTDSGDPARIKLNLASSQILFGVSYHFYNLFGGK